MLIQSNIPFIELPFGRELPVIIMAHMYDTGFFKLPGGK